MRNKTYRLFSILCILSLLAIGVVTNAQDNPENDSNQKHELVPLTEQSKNAKQVYTQLMHAVYLQSFDKDVNGARHLYDALVQQMPESPYLWYKRGQLRDRMQDIRGAENDTRKALELDPEYIPATWLLAQILVKRATYMRERNIDEVLDTLKKVIELDPDHLDAHNILADLAFQLRQYETAETSYKALTRILPFEPTFHARLGNIYYNLGRHQEAIDAYQRAIRIRPNDPDTQRSLGDLYLKTGKVSEAQDAFKKVLNIIPHDTEANLGMGLVLQELAAIQVGNGNIPPEQVDASELLQTAEMHLEQAISTAKERINNTRNPNRRANYRQLANQAQFALAHVCILSENFEKAKELFDNMLKNNPDDVDVIYGIASVYQTTEQFEKAETHLRKVLSLQPAHENALNALGYLYAVQGTNLDEAEALIKRALEKSPDNGAFLDSLGWVFFKQERFAESVTVLERANQEMPNSVEILMHLGDAYTKTGEHEKARRVWQQAQILEPDNDEILQRLNQ